jgi:hypothetical protein
VDEVQQEQQQPRGKNKTRLPSLPQANDNLQLSLLLKSKGDHQDLDFS